LGETNAAFVLEIRARKKLRAASGKMRRRRRRR
jgi:hypothetical protein